ncbi:hypothetical protein AC1031_000316 [Aphanomyces cochlioides]|nr:hypothetical protein AC1031_000316 [Aphanomyces cochlioides]
MSTTKPTTTYSTFDTGPVQSHPRKRASLISKLFLSWSNHLVFLQRQLNLEDVWPLEDDNTTAANTKTFALAYGRTNSVFWAGVQVFSRMYMWTGVLGLVMRLLELVGPLVLQKIVDNSSEIPLYYWLTILVLSKLARAFIWAHTCLQEQVLGMRFVGGLKGVLFKKLLAKASVQPTDAPNLVNVYSSDMSAILWAGISFHNLWLLLPQVAAISYMLYQEIRLAAFAGMGMIVLNLYLGWWISTTKSAVYKWVSKARDDRMQAVKQTFGSILGVKLHTWEQKCRANIQVLRDKELGHVWTLIFRSAVGATFMGVAPLLVSLVSFAVYTLVLGQPLTASKVFTSMALFRLLQTPLSELPMHTSCVFRARVSLQRIAAVLSQVDKPNRPLSTEQLDSNVAVSIDNGSFSWDQNQTQSILKNVSLTISRGDIVVVHGKVGSGKSSLCLAILGELYQTQGTSGVQGSIAYCPQEPWIQQMTVRDNILFGSPFDARKYSRVVDACGLLPDFEAMAHGDLTMVGSKGSTLSGGQKARMSLARACYSDADIVILDLPLAAIDAVVQKEIMTKCIETLLKMKTVILVTHNPDVIGADSVNRLVEVENGSLTYSVLKKSNALLSEGSEADSLREDLPLQSATKVHDVESAESEEWREEGDVNFAVYASYISACGGTPLVLWICMIQILWQTCQIASDVWLGVWSASADAAARTNWYIGIYSALCISSVLMVLLRTLVVATSGLKASTTLFDKMTSSLLGTSMSFFDLNPFGRIINRYADDISTIDTSLADVFGGVTTMCFALLGSLLTSAAAIQWGGLLIIPFLYLYFQLGKLYLQPSRELSRLTYVTDSPVYSYLSEVEQGFTSIRAFGSKYLERANERHAQHVDLNNRIRFAKEVINSWFDLRIMLQGTAIVAIVASGLVYFRPSLTAGLVGLAFNYVLMADASIVDLVKTYSWLEICMVAPERVLEYCNLDSQDPCGDSKTAFTLKQGAIDFNQVQLRYKPTGELVLKDVTFSIRQGEKIGIVGRTGAGKSSLTMVLFRMYPIESGSISIDGRDISTIAKHQLRRQLSIIPQSPVLFKETLRQYLDPFGSFDDAALWSVVSKAGLHKLVSEIPEKLSTELADKGSNLSVGERQMLCLARALLVQSKIVVLDEATAAMDHETDEQLQRVITTEFADATVLTIAHRLHTVMHSERIMVMDGGRVVEMDSSRALLAKEDGIFSRLAKDGGVLQP